MTLISFSQQPIPEWESNYNGLLTLGAHSVSIKADGFGNIYVLNKVFTDTSSGDFCIMKYASNGSFVWERIYNSPGNLNDVSVAFDVTQTGDVYLTGSSGLNFTTHITTIKYNSNGLFQWAKIFSGGNTDGPSDIRIDNNGDVIVIGGSFANGVGSALTIKYSSVGDSLWVEKFNPFSSNFNRKLFIDVDNNVYTAGYAGNDMLILKYDQKGILLWSRLYNSPQNYSDGALGITLDINGNIYVVGTSSVPSEFSDNHLLRLDNNGQINWVRTFTGIIPGNGKCKFPCGVVTSSNGSQIYYSTYCYNNSGYEIVTLSYSSSGDTQWVRRYWGNVDNSQNIPSDIIIDRFDNIYIAGTVSYPDSGEDFVLIKFLQNGLQQWLTKYNGPLVNSSNILSRAILDTSNNIFVTGSSSIQNNPLLYEATTIKYSQPVGIINNQNASSKEYNLFQNFPNPFNPSTKIIFSIPKRAYVQIQIYDILGRIKELLVQEFMNPAEYELTIDGSQYSSGVYFYQLVADGKIMDTKKFMIIK